MPATRHTQRRLPLMLLLGALIAWPLLHHAPPATCPPGVISCPYERDNGSQLVVVNRPQ